MMQITGLADFPSYYYKVGHLNRISYTVYGSTLASDQSLLEAELLIRFKHPKILMTYYNKLIFFFQLHASDVSCYDPVVDYPHLELRHSAEIPAETFSTTAKPQSTDTFAPVGCLSFLKAVKKMVLFNLSLARHVRLFGNYAVININGPHYQIMYVEPGLMPNGDLILSLAVKGLADLFDLSIIDVYSLPTIYACPSDFNHAIYLLPSGVRCHLFDPTDVQSNFVTKTNESNEKMLHLIELITGTEIHKEDSDSFWWVRLTPNLNHLNNQTSPISEFIHSVDNRKFILWPWKLCVLQLGRCEMPLSPETQSPQACKIHNPLTLLSSLMDLNISETKAATQETEGKTFPDSKNLEGVASKMEESADRTHNSIAQELHSWLDATPGNIEGLDFFNLSQSIDDESAKNDPSGKANETIVKDEQGESDDMDIDDLFGDDDGDDKPETVQNILQSQSRSASGDDHDPTPEGELNSTDGERRLLEPKSRLEQYKKSGSTEMPTTHASFLDISKDDMVIGSDYMDPGAPLPIVPTPLFTSNPPPSAPNCGASEEPGVAEDRPSLAPKAVSKSIFSPIVFNPLIKSNIDTKYGKGGKFYVDKDSANVSDPNISSRLRATSVNGLDPVMLIRTVKQNVTQDTDSHTPDDALSSDAIASDTSEESDADEQMLITDIPLSFQEGSSAPQPLEMGTDYRVLNPAGLAQEVPKDTTTSDQKSAIEVGSKAHTRDDSGIGESVGLVPESEGSNDHNSTLNTPNIFASRTSQLKVSSPFSLTEFRNNQTSVDTELFHGRTLTVLGQSPFSQHQPSPERMPFAGETTDSPDKQSFDGPKSAEFGKRSAESSNYLPLILRSINVASIPKRFLLKSSFSLPHGTFDINAVEKDDEWDLAGITLMSVKLHRIDDLLQFLVPQLVFDMKLNQCRSSFGFLVAGKSSHECMELVAAADTSRKVQPDMVLTLMMLQVFPLCYRVPIIELLTSCTPSASESESNELLDFLNKISHFDQDLESNPQKLMQASEWNCFQSLEDNEAALLTYRSALNKLVESTAVDNQIAFKVPVPKSRVLKSDQILNLNYTGLEYWNYLGLKPIGPSKDFQVILFGEKLPMRSDLISEFLNTVTHHYRASKLGEITKLVLPSVDGSLQVNDGLILVGHGNKLEPGEFYKQINMKLALLVELLRLEVIKKSESINFEKPLLIILINSNDTLSSTLLVSKLLRNFQQLLSEQQLPLLKVFVKVVPISIILKQDKGHVHPKTLSNYKLTKLALNLYNQCPTDIASPRIAKPLYSQLVKEPPSKISFKFLNAGQRDNDHLNDLFLHLSYERSADRTWLAAAWSDQFGCAFTKAWLCQSNTSSGNSRDDSFAQSRTNSGSHGISSICDQMWHISNDIFSELAGDQQLSSRLSSDKKFLVLTRINGIIPDEELVHWKRLSLKFKDISLIVLSVSDAPKVMSTANSTNETSKGTNLAPSPGQALRSPEKDSFKNTVSDSSDIDSKATCTKSSPTFGLALMASPSTGSCLQSPQQYLNIAGNMWSPRETVSNLPFKSEITSALQNSEFVLRDPKTDLVGVIPRLPLPLFSSPSRSSMKVGCLLKEVVSSEGTREYNIYELNLLSCSNYWDLDTLMKLLLTHYSRMIALRPILGLDEMDGPMHSRERDLSKYMVPWHVTAVSRVLEYLVHVRVDE